MEETLWGAGFLLMFFVMIWAICNYFPHWFSSLLSEFDRKHRR
jgi:hypothetical protein